MMNSRFLSRFSLVAERKAALEADLGAPRNWDAMLTQVERSLKATHQALSELRTRLQTLQQQRGVIEERLRGAEQAGREAEELRAALREGERRLQVLKVLAQAYGKSGIPALLIEQAVPDLEAVANDVLSVLSDGRMSLALRCQKETKAKTIQETLDIVIEDERGERSYENFSGGEAMRVDLALRIALSVLLASRAGARCELLVLDEAAAPLDAQGRAQFVECLQRVAERFATILVITHVEELKDLFPFRFEIAHQALFRLLRLGEFGLAGRDLNLGMLRVGVETRSLVLQHGDLRRPFLRRAQPILRGPDPGRHVATYLSGGLRSPSVAAFLAPSSGFRVARQPLSN